MGLLHGLLMLEEFNRLAFVYQFVRFFCAISDTDFHGLGYGLDLAFGHIAVFVASVVYNFIDGLRFQSLHIIHIFLASFASWCLHPFDEVLFPVLPSFDFDYYHSRLHFELLFRIVRVVLRCSLALFGVSVRRCARLLHCYSGR